MPESSIIITNTSVDVLGGSLNGAQLIDDSGVQSDIDGGFDVATITILAPSGLTPVVGEGHPTVPNLYLFGVSPRPLPGGQRQITLNYKGVAGRTLGTGEPPALGSAIGKFSYSMRLVEKLWPKGVLGGNVPGFSGNLANVSVNIMLPQRTVRVMWMGSSPIAAGALAINANGTGKGQFGPIDQDAYSSLNTPVYNYPNGWVAIESSSDQAYNGMPIWQNSITYVGIPRFTAG